MFIIAICAFSWKMVQNPLQTIKKGLVSTCLTETSLVFLVPPYYVFDTMHTPKDFTRRNYFGLNADCFAAGVIPKTRASSAIAGHVGPNRLLSVLNQWSNKIDENPSLLDRMKSKRSHPYRNDCLSVKTRQNREYIYWRIISLRLCYPSRKTSPRHYQES